MENHKLKNKEEGFLVLTMVLLVGATMLIVVTGVFLRSIGESKKISDVEISLRAQATANACSNYALYQLASTTESLGWSYGGNESLEIDSYICDIDSIIEYPSISDSKWIRVSATALDFVNRMSIVVATNTPQIIIADWSQVADFD